MQWRSQPKLGGGNTLTWKWETVFCLGHRLTKHKTTRCSKLGSMAPLPTPGYAFVSLGNSVDYSLSFPSFLKAVTPFDIHLLDQVDFSTMFKSSSRTLKGANICTENFAKTMLNFFLREFRRVFGRERKPQLFESAFIWKRQDVLPNVLSVHEEPNPFCPTALHLLPRIARKSTLPRFSEMLM